MPGPKRKLPSPPDVAELIGLGWLYALARAWPPMLTAPLSELAGTDGRDGQN
jgi:hypothetical protein